MTQQQLGAVENPGWLLLALFASVATAVRIRGWRTSERWSEQLYRICAVVGGTGFTLMALLAAFGVIPS